MFGDILEPTHLLFVLVVALLVLGPKRLPEVGQKLGTGLRDFRQAISGEVGDHDWMHTPEAAVEPPAEQRQQSTIEPTDATVVDQTPTAPVTEPVAAHVEPAVPTSPAPAPRPAAPAARRPAPTRPGAPAPRTAPTRPGAPTPRTGQPGAPLRRPAAPVRANGQHAAQPGSPPAAVASPRPVVIPPVQVPRPTPRPVRPPADTDSDA